MEYTIISPVEKAAMAAAMPARTNDGMPWLLILGACLALAIVLAVAVHEYEKTQSQNDSDSELQPQ